MKYIYITFLLFFIGCSSSLPDESLPLADHLKIGMDFLDQGKFVKAQDEFKLEAIEAKEREKEKSSKKGRPKIVASNS